VREGGVKAKDGANERELDSIVAPNSKVLQTMVSYLLLFETRFFNYDVTWYECAARDSSLHFKWWQNRIQIEGDEIKTSSNCCNC
jgi:hypothetical protein